MDLLRVATEEGSGSGSLWLQIKQKEEHVFGNRCHYTFISSFESIV